MSTGRHHKIIAMYEHVTLQIHYFFPQLSLLQPRSHTHYLLCDYHPVYWVMSQISHGLGCDARTHSRLLAFPLICLAMKGFKYLQNIDGFLQCHCRDAHSSQMRANITFLTEELLWNFTSLFGGNWGAIIVRLLMVDRLLLSSSLFFSQTIYSEYLYTSYTRIKWFVVQLEQKLSHVLHISVRLHKLPS